MWEAGQQAGPSVKGHTPHPPPQMPPARTRVVAAAVELPEELSPSLTVQAIPQAEHMSPSLPPEAMLGCLRGVWCHLGSPWLG